MNDNIATRLIKSNAISLAVVLVLLVALHLYAAYSTVVLVAIAGISTLIYVLTVFLAILAITFAWRLIVCVRSKKKGQGIRKFQYTAIPKLIAAVIVFLIFVPQTVLGLLQVGFSAFDLAYSLPFSLAAVVFLLLAIAHARVDFKADERLVECSHGGQD